MEMMRGRLVHINFWEGAMNFTGGSSSPTLNFHLLHIFHSPLGSCWADGNVREQGTGEPQIPPKYIIFTISPGVSEGLST